MKPLSLTLFFRVRNILTVSIAIGLQAGCSTWPAHGQGGLAENYLDRYIPVEENATLTPQHGLRFDSELLRRQLKDLEQQGANYCFPATVAQSKEREKRISREIHGKLFFDAGNDILVQRSVLSRLERRLNYVTAQGACVPPKALSQGMAVDSIRKERCSGNRADLGKILYNLLNSDNQFATDSYQLNPKYIARLSEAAMILRDHLEFKLNIIGHTDNQGSEIHNKSLSTQRAEQVARYLYVLGVSKDRVKTGALGNENPLFELKDGHVDQSHVRLVNRRVSIDLIEPDTLLENKMNLGHSCSDTKISSRAGEL